MSLAKSGSGKRVSRFPFRDRLREAGSYMLPAKFQKFLNRLVTVRRVIIFAPVLAVCVVIAVVLFGIKQAEYRLDHIEQKVEESLSYQYSAMTLAVLLEQAQASLNRLSTLHEGGRHHDEDPELLQTLWQIENRLLNLSKKLDPRVRTLDLEQRLTWIRDVVTQAENHRGDVPIPTYPNEFKEITALFTAIAGQTRILVLQDIEVMKGETVDLIWRLFQILQGLGVLLCAFSLSLSRLISRPILSLAHTVEALDRGNLEITVPVRERTDEIGKVANAIERFKVSLKQNKVLMNERDDLNTNLERKVNERTLQLAVERERLSKAQADAAVQRREMTRQLRAEFGDVIKAASAGDFAQRVDVAYADENLQSLASDINQFVAQVDQSVSAISHTMNDLAEGTLDTALEHDFTGAFADIMSLVRDTGAKIGEQSRQLTHIAFHDALTGLPNRRSFEERLADYSKLLSIGSMPLAVLHIDLDRFKEINDALGHAAGDLVLKKAASVIATFAKDDDFLARVGGDEFMMLCPMQEEYSDGDEAMRIRNMGEAIIAELAKPIVIDANEARFGASIGISFSTPETTDLSVLVVDADLALYKSKESGRNQVQVFSHRIAQEITNERNLRDALTTAVERSEFCAFYQPKFDAVTYELVGVEALVRWDHPTEGILAPISFLPTAYDMGIVDKIDHIVLCKSATALNSLYHEHGILIPELSVNVSQERLSDPSLLDSVAEVNGPFRLTFELLESIAFDDQGDRFAWMLDALRERDIGIQIDDFGSGRASISALLNINPERLKIDRNLITPIIEKENNRQLVRGIIDIAQSMSIKVTAEGIETMEHAKVAQQLGCDCLQGYAFSRPLSEDAFRSFCMTTQIAKAHKTA